jgi:Cytochrome c554 and c-prime
VHFGFRCLTVCPTVPVVCSKTLGAAVLTLAGVVAISGCTKSDSQKAQSNSAAGSTALVKGGSDSGDLPTDNSSTSQAQLGKPRLRTPQSDEQLLEPVSIQPAESNLAVETPTQNPADSGVKAADMSLASTVVPPKDNSLAVEDRLVATDRAVGPTAALPDQTVPPKNSSRVLATDAEKNQRIAEAWPKPWAVFVITGQQMGYIEPCGCTGLENQKGGLNRRDSLIAELRARDYPIVPIDVGNQERRMGRQGQLKFIKTVEAMKQMDYRAVALGPEDLKFSPVDLMYSMSDVDGSPSPFVSSNVRLFDSYPEELKIIEVSNRKIGITSFLGKTTNDLNNADVKILDPIESLKQAVPKLKAAGCEYLVVLAHASIEESIAVAKAVPEFDLVVTAGGIGEPTYKPEPIEGTKSVLVQVGVKGMYVGILGLFEDKNIPPRYQRLALSSQFPDSPRMMELFAKYQQSLEQIGFEGLGLRTNPHPSTREFVGTEKCGECHTKAMAVWKDSPHAHATDSIVKPPERSDVARHFDPECVSCHVTGWHPQEFYPYHSGYTSIQDTPNLVGSGCENCHGPGSAHVAAESGDMEADEAMLAKLREEMRLPMTRAEDKCLECHDMDNSPAFHDEGAFQKYWDQIKHYGKD